MTPEEASELILSGAKLWKSCPLCNGEGSCPVYNGRKTVKTAWKELTGLIEHTRFICRICRGLGHLRDEETKEAYQVLGMSVARNDKPIGVPLNSERRPYPRLTKRRKR